MCDIFTWPAMLSAVWGIAIVQLDVEVETLTDVPRCKLRLDRFTDSENSGE
jgi:hypothetical protein